MDGRVTKCWLVGLVAGFGLWVAACDSGSDPVPDQVELVGKWNFTEIEYKFETKVTPVSEDYPDEFEDTLLDVADQGAYIDFKSDGFFAAEFPDLFSGLAKNTGTLAGQGNEQKGSWSLSGSGLTLVSESDGTLKFTVSGTGNSRAFKSAIHDSISEAGYTTRTSGYINYKATLE